MEPIVGKLTLRLKVIYSRSRSGSSLKKSADRHPDGLLDSTCQHPALMLVGLSDCLERSQITINHLVSPQIRVV